MFVRVITILLVILKWRALQVRLVLLLIVGRERQNLLMATACKQQMMRAAWVLVSSDE